MAIDPHLSVAICHFGAPKERAAPLRDRRRGAVLKLRGFDRGEFAPDIFGRNPVLLTLLGDLCADPLHAVVGARRGIRLDPGRVKGHDADLDEIDFGGEPQHRSKKSASSSSWSLAKRATVAWSGASLAAMKRNATSSIKRVSILGDDLVPVA